MNLENNNKLYKTSRKCDNKQQYKNILEAAMVSNLEGFTDNSSMSPSPLMAVKNISARKSIRQFTELLEGKNKTASCRLGAAK